MYETATSFVKENKVSNKTEPANATNTGIEDENPIQSKDSRNEAILNKGSVLALKVSRSTKRAIRPERADSSALIDNPDAKPIKSSIKLSLEPQIIFERKMISHIAALLAPKYIATLVFNALTANEHCICHNNHVSMRKTMIAFGCTKLTEAWIVSAEPLA